MWWFKKKTAPTPAPYALVDVVEGMSLVDLRHLILIERDKGYAERTSDEISVAISKILDGRRTRA